MDFSTRGAKSVAERYLGKSSDGFKNYSNETLNLSYELWLESNDPDKPPPTYLGTGNVTFGAKSLDDIERSFSENFHYMSNGPLDVTVGVHWYGVVPADIGHSVKQSQSDYPAFTDVRSDNHGTIVTTIKKRNVKDKYEIHLKKKTPAMALPEPYQVPTTAPSSSNTASNQPPSSYSAQTVHPTRRGSRSRGYSYRPTHQNPPSSASTNTQNLHQPGPREPDSPPEGQDTGATYAETLGQRRDW